MLTGSHQISPSDEESVGVLTDPLFSKHGRKCADQTTAQTSEPYGIDRYGIWIWNERHDVRGGCDV